MNQRKWHKFRASKAQFPTRIICNGNKGVLHIGHVEARAHLSQQLGRSLADAVLDHNGGEWIFKYPINDVPQRQKVSV